MNDDQLILYYYDDGLSRADRRRIAAAIEADEQLAERYAALCRELDSLSASDNECVAPAHVVQRMHDTIDRAGRPVPVADVPPPHRFSLPAFAWGAAVTAALAIGIGIGIFVTRAPTVPLEDAPVMAATQDRGAFTRGVQVFFQDAHADLVSMPVADASDRSRLITNIIEQNRLFERAAAQNDAQDLARVLRAFEPILQRLAADDITPAEAEALRSQLAFELNVMLTKISRGSSNETHTT
ncbi:MAG: hypothetical protein P8X98_14920 [Woeseiaceae bacterium]